MKTTLITLAAVLGLACAAVAEKPDSVTLYIDTSGTTTVSIATSSPSVAVYGYVESVEFDWLMTNWYYVATLKAMPVKTGGYTNNILTSVLIASNAVFRPRVTLNDVSGAGTNTAAERILLYAERLQLTATGCPVTNTMPVKARVKLWR